MSINEILTEIANPDSLYSEIMDNILGHRQHLKQELISEIAISFLERPDTIEKVWADGYGKYYFIRVVMNNVNSNTSPFYKNVIKTDYKLINGFDYDMIDDSESDIEDKIIKEEQIKAIKNEYNKIEKNWSESTIWNEYYKKGKTFRQIEQDWGIDHCLAYHMVNKLRKEIKKNVKI